VEAVLVAEGLHLAREALRSGARIELVVVTPELEQLAQGRELLALIGNRSLDCVETSVSVLESLQDARAPQPILMLVSRRRGSVDDALAAAGPAPLVVVALGVQDPGNLGSLVRSADAAGAAACFVGERCADPYHPRAVRATMGSIFRLPLFPEPGRLTIDRLRQRTLRLVGTDPRQGVDYHRAVLTGGTALFFGGEGAGLEEPWRGSMDSWVRIPMRAGVESLSVGAAASVVLFEAARQRGDAQPSDL
jgi:TrmH family RNA methyltransferase